MKISKIKMAVFKFKPFSKKQRKVLNWWTESSPVKDKDGIIADGAVRSGKTVSMALSFVMWAMTTFSGQNLAMCGKTIGSFKRNVWFWLKLMLWGRGYKVSKYTEMGDNVFVISRNGISNYFYIFGGKDERSQDLIQGLTLAGIFFDEVALMPESFVVQGTLRCSVDGSKFWFNCNPDSPAHWFYENWILKAKEKNLIHLHFTMDDNLSLSEEIKARYRRQYVGVFFKRFILGLWVVAEGAIYDMWDDIKNLFDDDTAPQGLKYISRRYITVDHGTTNPTVFLDIRDDGTTLWVLNEYYYSSKEKGVQKTDAQYADDFEEFVGDEIPDITILDPSAASFKAELRNRGYRIKDADNEVNDGIRMTATMIEHRKIKVHKRCVNTRKELLSYVWDEKASQRGEEKPVKQNDHAPDALRYFVKTMIKPRRLAS